MLGVCTPILSLRSPQALAARLPSTTACLSAYHSSHSSTRLGSVRIQHYQLQQIHHRVSPSETSPRLGCKSFTARNLTSQSSSPFTILRRASNFTATTARNAPQTVSPPSSSPPSAAKASRPASNDTTLTWNRFLALRKTRRRISQVVSVITAVFAIGAGNGAIMAWDLDTLGAQTFALDPFLVSLFSTVALGAGGWLIGPFFGNTIFNIVNRRYAAQIRAKEKEFYARIRRFRVDPSSSSMANPVPDYYGEKIGSIADYRRWLKDQRAFNLKRGRPI